MSVRAIVNIVLDKRLLKKLLKEQGWDRRQVDFSAEAGISRRSLTTALSGKPVGQGVAVAVLDVGFDLFADVPEERDGGGVAAERRARQGKPPLGVAHGGDDAVAPRQLAPGMMDLVEDRHPAPGQGAELVGCCRHLLVGGDDAVEVARQPVLW